MVPREPSTARSVLLMIAPGSAERCTTHRRALRSEAAKGFKRNKSLKGVKYAVHLLKSPCLIQSRLGVVHFGYVCFCVPPASPSR